MIDIKVNRTHKTASVIQDGNIIKSEELNPEEFKDIMKELCGDRLDTIRECTRLFKVKSFTFKGVNT